LHTYVRKGTYALSKVGSEPNKQNLDNDFIDEIFMEYKNEIYEYWEQVSNSIRDKYREKIW